jgi:hypothetical protein
MAGRQLQTPLTVPPVFTTTHRPIFKCAGRQRLVTLKSMFTGSP